MKNNEEIAKTAELKISSMSDEQSIGSFDISGKDIAVAWKRDKHNHYEIVSASPKDASYLTWTEIHIIRDTFFQDNEVCVQIFDKEKEGKGMTKNCLHLWRRTDGKDYLH